MKQLSMKQFIAVIAIFILSTIAFVGCNEGDADSFDDILPVVEDDDSPKEILPSWEFPVFVSETVIRVPPHKTSVRVYSIPSMSGAFNSAEELASFNDDGELLSLNEIGGMTVSVNYPVITITLADGTWDKFDDAELVDEVVSTYIDYLEMQ